MLRWIFIILIFGHALIHLMGFAKAFGFASFEQITRPISRLSGLFWLAAAALLLASVLVFAFSKSYWWMLGLTGALLCQILIITVWQDARWGTVPNVIVLVAALVAGGTWMFQRQVAGHRTVLINSMLPGTETVVDSLLSPLPQSVRTWLVHSQVVGKPIDRQVSLTQQGRMRTKPDGAWMSFTASQNFSINPPAFVWQTDVALAGGLFMVGEDRYYNGRGEMLIKLLGLVTVVRSSGPEIDQGTLLRYLGEMCWLPSAALSPYIKWKELDANRAEATMSYGGVSASGIFTFDEQGDVTGFEAMRYGEFEGVSRLERWHIECADHREMDGVRVPTRCAVSWKFKDGDFKWLELQVTNLQRK
jgi:hypothetical protein